VLTGSAGDEFAAVFSTTRPTIERYAAQFGYDFATCDMAGTASCAVVQDSGAHQALQQYERVLWIDADRAGCSF
jgi:hypothetical protein